jgi:hypothetical protein
MTDYSQHSVLLPALVRDVQSALRRKDWDAAIHKASDLMVTAAAVAAVATERKCDEILDTVWPE